MIEVKSPDYPGLFYFLTMQHDRYPFNWYLAGLFFQAKWPRQKRCPDHEEFRRSHHISQPIDLRHKKEAEANGQVKKGF